MKQARASASERAISHLLKNRMRKVIARRRACVPSFLDNSLSRELVESRNELLFLY